VIIPFPIKLDIVDACKKMQKADTWSCSLTLLPFIRLDHEASIMIRSPITYLKLAGSKEYIFVGVDDGSVWLPKSK
jgi:hypothetical protein